MYLFSLDASLAISKFYVPSSSLYGWWMENDDAPIGDAPQLRVPQPLARKLKKPELFLSDDDDYDKYKQRLLNNNQFVSLADNPQTTSSQEIPVV